jgi:hypothetical protein
LLVFFFYPSHSPQSSLILSNFLTGKFLRRYRVSTWLSFHTEGNRIVIRQRQNSPYCDPRLAQISLYCRTWCYSFIFPSLRLQNHTAFATSRKCTMINARRQQQQQQENYERNSQRADHSAMFTMHPRTSFNEGRHRVYHNKSILLSWKSIGSERAIACRQRFVYMNSADIPHEV